MNIDTLAKTTGDIDFPTPERLAAGRHQLDVAIHAADVRVTTVLRRRRRRRRGVSALAGAAAAAATAVFAMPLFPAVPASAEEVLLAAADAAGQQVDEAAGAAYWHVTSEVDYPYTEPFRREKWVSRSGESI